MSWSIKVVTMYFGKGMRDFLRTTQLSSEFFEDLDEFQVNFLDMCFKQSIESNMGLMTSVENYNYHLFEDFKISRLELDVIVNSDNWKKAA